MNEEVRKTLEPRPLPALRSKPVKLTKSDLVSVQPLFPNRPFPTLITPKFQGLNLAEWAADNRDYVQALWEEKRALLFRDFDLGGISGFQQVVEATADGPCLPYLDRSTPRKEYAPNIYCTTIYPPEYRIRLHNEGSYWTVHPQKAHFGCITAPDTGGETPIGDMHAVYNRIDPEIRNEFEARKWMLVRNYNYGMGLPWQEVYQTTDRGMVEAFCRENSVEFEWRDQDHLRTKQIRLPILQHPRTGEQIWHNHAAFFHITTWEVGTREVLQRTFGEDELPYNTFYGDGGAITPDVIQHINEAYDAELVKFTWQEGDVHLIDNIRLAHAREAFSGDRLILVALTEPYIPLQ